MPGVVMMSLTLKLKKRKSTKLEIISLVRP
jgi:hypothetical protein